tara:strand:+ start:175 stop:576 length:402 start_codon:yes stop_codon:yes gene_type:complete
MAIFARINDNGLVLKVESVHNDVLKDENGNEQESIGVQFLRDTYQEQSSNWKQGSYNTWHNVHKLGGTAFRYNKPSDGSVYDSTRDAFIPPKPFESWVLDESICDWKAPVDLPGDEKLYRWNEATTTWDLIPE